jgi:dUTP pyrophosphatase
MSEEFGTLDENELNSIMEMLNEMDIDENEEVDYESIINTFGLDIKDLEKSMDGYVPKMEVTFFKSNPDAVSPKYAYESDSGFDLYSTEEMTISSLDRILIPTGIHIDIPEGYEIQVRSKSGLALKQGLMVLNSPGTVDQGYTGEIQIIMFNTTKNKVKIEKGQKVAQAVLCPVVSGKWINIIEKNKLNIKDRNENGFGSTGLV